jgi:hypothetical protein
MAIGATTLTCSFSNWWNGVCLPGCQLADYLMGTCPQQLTENVADTYEYYTYGTVAPAPTLSNITPAVPTSVDPTIAFSETMLQPGQVTNSLNDLLNSLNITGQPLNPLLTSTWLGDYGIWIIGGVIAFIALEKI